LGTDVPESVPQLADVVIWAMHQTRDGAIWFAGEGGATRFDPGTGDWQQFEADPGPLPAWLVTDIVEDEAGVWLSTMGGGVAFYDGSRWETYHTDDALGGNVVEAIREDHTGGLWFSHPGTGLSRYDPQQDAWQVFGEAEGALDWPSIPAVDSQGHVWIGGYGELLRYDGSIWQRFTPGELTDISVYAMAVGLDDVQWLLTDVGLMRHDPATDALTPLSASDHPALREPWVVATFRDGSAWAGGADGLARYDGSGWNTPSAAGQAPVAAPGRPAGARRTGHARDARHA
jgi:ligand-binding sensor domain-containing protein